MKTFLFTSSMLFIKTLLLPDTGLLTWMSIAIVLDFMTGIAKAIILKQARTSSGYRKTITKFLQYGGAIAAGMILNNGITPNQASTSGVDHSAIVKYINDGLLIYIIYIEVTSIFENIYICDQKTKFARYIIAPILKLLTFQLKGTPLTPINEKPN